MEEKYPDNGMSLSEMIKQEVALNVDSEVLIEKINSIIENATFFNVARDLIKHLNNPKLYHPHYTAIIKNNNAELLEDCTSSPISDYVD